MAKTGINKGSASDQRLHEQLLHNGEYDYQRSSSLRIHESNSAIFYQMTAPFQITYEHCSGYETGLEDYISITTLSNHDRTYSRERLTFHNKYFRRRASHFHDYYEFMLVLNGELIQRIEGHEYKYTTGTCCLLSRSLCHLENFSSAADVLFVGISVELMQELLQADGRLFSVESRIASSPICRFVRGDLEHPGEKNYLDFTPLHADRSLPQLRDLARAMFRELLYPRYGSSYLIRGFLCTFIWHLCDPEIYRCSHIRAGQDNRFLLFSRISRLLENSQGRCHRADLEQQLHYSGDYLNRIVNQYTKMSLHEYALTFRLSEAERLIRSTKQPITAIMAQLGFTNQNYFYRLFQKQYGMTPLAYRKASVQDTADESMNIRP